MIGSTLRNQLGQAHAARPVRRISTGSSSRRMRAAAKMTLPAVTAEFAERLLEIVSGVAISIMLVVAAPACATPVRPPSGIDSPGGVQVTCRDCSGYRGGYQQEDT